MKEFKKAIVTDSYETIKEGDIVKITLVTASFIGSVECISDKGITIDASQKFKSVVKHFSYTDIGNIELYYDTEVSILTALTGSYSCAKLIYEHEAEAFMPHETAFFVDYCSEDEAKQIVKDVESQYNEEGYQYKADYHMILGGAVIKIS